MDLLKKIHIRQLNGYSWSIIVAFIFASVAMEYNTDHSLLDSACFTIPLIFIAVFWCEKTAYLMAVPDYRLTKKESFSRDLFLISYSFFLACLLSLLSQHNNSDAKAWWSLYILYIGLYGFLFSFLFSLIAVMISNHKTYTIVFSFIIISVLSIIKFYPPYTSVVYIGKIESYYMITGSLLLGHFLFFIGWKLSRLSRRNTSI